MNDRYVWLISLHQVYELKVFPCEILHGFPGTISLEKPPDLDPFFDDLTRAKSAKELTEHLETRVL